MQRRSGSAASSTCSYSRVPMRNWKSSSRCSSPHHIAIHACNLMPGHFLPDICQGVSCSGPSCIKRHSSAEKLLSGKQLTAW